VPGEEYDARGLESLPYDLGKYLERLGPDAAIKTFAEFADATKAEDPFASTGVLSYMPRHAGFNACLADPTKPPDMSAFIALREKHLSIFNEVFARHRLDAAIFPQMREQLAAREAKDIIHETTVSEINIAGLPGVTVPAGSYASGSPFNLIAIGPQWSEAELLGITFAYEQATRHRKAPTLSRS
jgi:amidase